MVPPWYMKIKPLDLEDQSPLKCSRILSVWEAPPPRSTWFIPIFHELNSGATETSWGNMRTNHGTSNDCTRIEPADLHILSLLNVHSCLFLLEGERPISGRVTPETREASGCQSKYGDQQNQGLFPALMICLHFWSWQRDPKDLAAESYPWYLQLTLTHCVEVRSLSRFKKCPTQWVCVAGADHCIVSGCNFVTIYAQRIMSVSRHATVERTSKCQGETDCCNCECKTSGCEHWNRSKNNHHGSGQGHIFYALFRAWFSSLRLQKRTTKDGALQPQMWPLLRLSRQVPVPLPTLWQGEVA